jgi:UDP-sugar transporter A1/2/3
MASNHRNEDFVRLMFYVSVVAVVFPLWLVLFSDSYPASSHNKLRVEGLLSTGKNSADDKSTGTFSVPPTVFFILLSIQCGCQPVLTKLFMPTTIVRSTAVLGQEGVKFVISMAYLASSNDWSAVAQGWTLEAAFVAAGVPSGLYVIQNYLNVMATQTLPPVTFIVLNQMKTLSTALCCFLFVGQRQSPLQILALMCLIAATLVIQKIVPLRCQNASESVTESKPSKPINSGDDTKADNDREPLQKEEVSSEETLKKSDAKDEAARQLMWGVVPALCASFLSGLAGTFAQKALQESGRSPHLFNSELAVFSSSYLVASMALGSPDCQKMKASGVSRGWTWKTWIPIVTNAVGGILVGLVTKYQGAVVKGFATIFGMAISGALQQTLFAKTGGGITREQVVGGCLGGLSLWMHISFQPSKS